MEEGLYTAVKHFAVHDGPGIRTTLFLKGCNLHCLWCHNPETISAVPQLLFHDQLCRNCGRCVETCACHSMKNGVHSLDRTDCKVCGKCTEKCLNGALELCGKKITVDEAAEKLLEDREFYGESGGGITLSGGEPLRQSSFCRVLLERMKKKDIHTAVDTCGHVPWTAFESVMEYTDLFLYDFKVADSEKHRKYTGQHNDLILENLKWLCKTGKPVEIRMIQLPGMNMGEEDLQNAGAFLGSLSGIRCVRLLAYHDYARSKYRAAGMKDTMPKISLPSPEDLTRSAEILRVHGLTVKF